MAIRVNTPTGRDSSGRITYDRGTSRPVYRERDGGGYERVIVSDSERRDSDVSADRGLARGIADREAVQNLQSQREFESGRQFLLSQEGGGGGFSTSVDGREGYGSSQLLFSSRGGRVSDVAASSSSFVASTRRSPNEFITAEGGRAVPTASINDGFLYRDVMTPTSRPDVERSARNVLQRDVVARPILSYVEGRRTIGDASGAVAARLGSYAQERRDYANALGSSSGVIPSYQRVNARSAAFLGSVGAGYFSARQRTPELFAVDVASYGLGRIAGVGLGAGVNRAVTGLSRFAPAASLGIVRGAGYAGGATLAAGTYFGARAAINDPEAFGATGLTSLAFFGGAARGFSSTAGVQLGRVRYGRPTTPELRVGEYGNALTFYTQRSATQSVRVFGQAAAPRRGVSGISGFLEPVRGGFAGRAESITTLRSPSGVTQSSDAFLIAPTRQRGTIGALRLSDRQLFALGTRTRTDATASALNIDPVRVTTGRIATVDSLGRVQSSRSLRLASTEFGYRGASTFRSAQIDNLFTAQEFVTSQGLRTFSSAAGLSPRSARAPRGYGRAAVEGLRRQGYLPENVVTSRIGTRGSIGGQAPRYRTVTELSTVSRGSPTNLAPYRALGALQPLSPRSVGGGFLGALSVSLNLRSGSALESVSDTFARSRTSMSQELSSTVSLAQFQRQQLSSLSVQSQRQNLVSQQLFPNNASSFLPPPPFAPVGFLPPLPPPFGAGGALSGFGGSPREASRGFSYAPSLIALLGGIRSGSASSSPLGGLEVRPIVRRRNRR